MIKRFSTLTRQLLKQQKYIQNQSLNSYLVSLTQKQPFYFCNAKPNLDNKVNINLEDPNEEFEVSFSEKNKELLSSIDEYEKALAFFQKGKYRISNEFFKRVLHNLEKTN